MIATCYELVLEHAPTGKRYLVCYTNLSPSRSRLIRAVRNRWANIERKMGYAVPKWMFGTKARDGIYVDDWELHYSGRTEREAKQSGELEYCS